MLVYGNPITDWLTALAVFAVLYTLTIAGWLAIEQALRRRDAGRTE